MYNEAIKTRFLESIENEGSRHTISYIFKASKTTEEILGKDLYNFSIEEVGLILSNMTSGSIGSVRNHAVNIKMYISWCIQNGYRDNNLNPLDGYGKEWFEQFVDKTKKIHWEEEEFYKELIEKLDNAQDQALFSLIFEGILGKAFSELKEITVHDIDWNKNEIKIKRNGEDKIFTLSNRVMRYVEQANIQPTYRFLNKKTGDYSEKEIVPSDYLFKNVRSPRTKEGEPLSIQTFYTRMQAIRDMFSLDMLTPNAIKQSGLNAKLAKIAKDKISNGEEPILGYEEFAYVGEIYDSPKLTQGTYQYFNTYLIRQFANENTLKELYDLDVIIQKR